MMYRVDELTRKDLLRDVDRVTVKRAADLRRAKYRGIHSDYTIEMEVPSSTGDGSYTVFIQMVEYPELDQVEDLLVDEKVRLAMDGDLKIWCQCPAFRFFGFEYITTQLSANRGAPQERFPHTRNPKLVGVMCKHAYKAIKGFGSNWLAITNDIKNGRFLS